MIFCRSHHFLLHDIEIKFNSFLHRKLFIFEHLPQPKRMIRIKIILTKMTRKEHGEKSNNKQLTFKRFFEKKHTHTDHYLLNIKVLNIIKEVLFELYGSVLAYLSTLTIVSRLSLVSTNLVPFTAYQI